MRFSAGRYFFEIPDKWKDIAGVRRKGARVDIVLLWEEEPGCSGLLASLKCLKRKIARPDGWDMPTGFTLGMNFMSRPYGWEYPV